jgi:hypothetical protein
MFRKPDLFPSSGKGRETPTVSENLFYSYLEFRSMDSVKNPSDSKCYIHHRESPLDSTYTLC